MNAIFSFICYLNRVYCRFECSPVSCSRISMGKMHKKINRGISTYKWNVTKHFHLAKPFISNEMWMIFQFFGLYVAKWQNKNNKSQTPCSSAKLAHTNIHYCKTFIMQWQWQSLNWIRKTEKCILHKTHKFSVVADVISPQTMNSHFNVISHIFYMYIDGNYSRSLYEFAQFDKLKIGKWKKEYQFEFAT